MNYVILIFICLIYSCSSELSKSTKDNFSKKNVEKRVGKNKPSESETAFLNSKHQGGNIIQNKIINNAQKMKQCDKDFITKLPHFLDIFNISLPFNDIENLRKFIHIKTRSESRVSGLSFVIILDMKQVYPQYGYKEMKKVYEANELTQKEKLLFLNNFEKYHIDNMKLIQTVENIFQENKSLIQIHIDVNFKQDNGPVESEKMLSFSEKERVLNKFFGKKQKQRRKKLKVQKFSSSSIFIGISLSLLSSILCGLSFVLKKWSLLKMERGKSYYFDKNWWFGQSLMMVGDTLHFAAFYFAPTLIVCTLQILTVIVTAIASSSIIGEKMHKYGKLAFALSISGCWVIVFHVPNEPHVYSIDTFLYMLSDHIFLIYIAVLSIITAMLISFWIPKYGKINSLGYTILSAIFGSISVLGLKGMILGYTDTLSHWLPWASFSVVSVLLLVHLEYLNKALSIYNTQVVTTQYYVLYSSFVIFESSLLFKVWKISSYETIFTSIWGFITVGLGALILTIFEEENATFDFSRLFPGPEKKRVKS